MEENYTYHIDDLLVKYLLQEATPHEQQHVEQWMQQSDANRQYFKDFTTIWEESRKLAATTSADETAAWQRFTRRIAATDTGRVVSLRRSLRLIRSAAAILAAVAILAAAYFLFINKPAGNTMIAIRSGNAPLTDTLADGSVVTLNKHSILTHPRQFADNIRSIHLEGEAFFTVTHDKNKPFVVRINDVTVKVLGTSFNIKSINGTTEVIVEAGMVQVSRGQQAITLTPDQKTLVQPGASELRKDSSYSRLYNYYHSKVFVCNNTPLWQLVAVLNEAYDAHITIENKDLRNQPLNTTFNEEPLDNILSVIATTLYIKVEKKDNQIILK